MNKEQLKNIFDELNKLIDEGINIRFEDRVYYEYKHTRYGAIIPDPSKDKKVVVSFEMTVPFKTFTNET